MLQRYSRLTRASKFEHDTRVMIPTAINASSTQGTVLYRHELIDDGEQWRVVLNTKEEVDLDEFDLHEAQWQVWSYRPSTAVVLRNCGSAQIISKLSSTLATASLPG